MLNKIIKYKLIYLIPFLLIIASCALKENYLFKTIPDNVTYEMRRPYFWISKLKNSEKIIMTSNEIKIFNGLIAKKHLIFPFNISWLRNNSNKIKNEIVSTINYFKNKPHYFDTGKKVDEYFFKTIEENIDIANFNKPYVKYGITISFALQRLLPTDVALYNRKDEFFFDRLQNNGFDIGSYLVILHESKDKRWYYTVSAYSSGWIKKENIALCNFNDFFLIDRLNFIVITSGKADIFLDKHLSNYWQTVRMGTRFILLSMHDKFYKILLPIKNKKGFLEYKYGYIHKCDAVKGFLDYTQKNVILQAFKLLNTPYGWGDMYMEQDCSKFIQEIFFTFGITLPRNSSMQAKVGYNIYKKNETEKLSLSDLERFIYKNAIPGITLLQISGHIMLYIGYFNGNNYIIHDTFGYSKKVNGRSFTFLINKVEVTPLNIGTILSRMEHIVVVDLDK